MTDLEEETEGYQMARIEEILDEWANMDVHEAIEERISLPNYLFLKIELNKPEGIHHKAWRTMCVDYFIDSHRYRKSIEYLKETFDVEKATLDTYIDTFSWMYTQTNPSNFKTSAMIERGW